MTHVAGTNFLLYNQLTQKAGDSLAAATIGTSKTGFASKVTIKGGTLTAGSLLRVDFMGMYTSSALTPPTVTPRVEIGGTPIVSGPAVSNPAGSAGLGFSGYVLITILNGTAVNNVEASGFLSFAASVTSSVTVNVPAAITSVDLTTDKDLTLTIQYGAGTAGNSLNLQQLVVSRMGAVNASN